MFEATIESLTRDLDDLRAKRHKCYELMGKAGDQQKKELDIKLAKLCHAVDRVALCLDILNYRVSVEPDETFTAVKFPKANARVEAKQEAAPITSASEEKCSCCGATSWWWRADGTGPVCGVCHPDPTTLPGPAQQEKMLL